MGYHKSTLVARGANTQLDPSCVSVPPATNVELMIHVNFNIWKINITKPAQILI